MLKTLVILWSVMLVSAAAAAPIHEAARAGDLDALENLAAPAATLNEADEGGLAPLHHAAIGNHLAVVRWLLEAGADIDPLDRSGQTPLFIALDRGRNRTAVALLEAGADHRRLGNHAVARAVRTKCSRAVEIMIERGASVDAPDRDGRTPLALAVQKNRADIAALLLDGGADPNVTVAGGNPLLCWAAVNGQKSIVEKLLERGASLSGLDPFGRNALVLAADHGHTGIAAILRSRGLARIGGSTIIDGRAMLDRPVADGEAVFWHLGHCGWAIRTSRNLLVFDYLPPHFKPAHPGLINGFLETAELAGRKVTIFVTHGHRDHFDPAIYALADIDARFVYGFEPGTPGCGSQGRYTGPAYELVGPREKRNFDGMFVETLASNDLGVGFLVTVDGVTVYHAGDHAGWRDNEKPGFTREIDYLASLGRSVDVAFLNITGCHAHGQCPLEDGTAYTLTTLEPKAWFPTHAGDAEYKYAAFEERVIAQAFPSRMIRPDYRGDVFLYRGGKVQRP